MALPVMATVVEEQEIAPPPPLRGQQFTWDRKAKGQVQRTEAQAVRNGTTSTPAATTTASENSPTPHGNAPRFGNPAPMEESNAIPVVANGELPPAPAIWKFREQTTAFADSFATKIPGGILVRAFKCAALHRDAFRSVALRAELNREAFQIAAVLLGVGLIGAFLSGFFTPGLLMRVAALRVVGWACALFAIRFAAKSMYRIDLPPWVWFRVLIFAQVPTVLSIIPMLGIVGGIWSILCMAAAIHDVTARQTNDVAILTVLGVVASAAGGYFLTSILPTPSFMPVG